VNHFTELIDIDGESLFFSFYRIRTVEGQKFFVSVSRHHKPFVFEMKKDDSGEWKINESAPEWIKPLRGILDQVIKREQSKNS
jgi:hypothetical protein